MSRHLDTLAVHAGAHHVDGAVVGPIFPSANYLHADVDAYEAVRYQRLGNSPQHVVLHHRLAALEGAEAATTFASGMAAVSSTLLALLSAGDHAVVSTGLYGATEGLLHRLTRLGVSWTAVAPDDLSAWRAAIRPETRVLYTESVSNPLLDVPDLRGIADLARARGIVSVVDNTFLSPVLFRPVPFGFDLVLHSATKYLNGHSDVIAGVVAGSAALVGQIAAARNLYGGSLDAFPAYLLERGLKTLPLRVRRQVETASALASWLSAHPVVQRVRYPGLPGDPAYDRAATCFDGPGAMITLDLVSDAAADRFFERLRLFVHAASLGGVESLVVRPARTSHLALGPARRAELGIHDRTVRMSVGVEALDDLRDDLASALDQGAP